MAMHSAESSWMIGGGGVGGGLITDDTYENPESLVIHKHSHPAVRQDMCDILICLFMMFKI